MGGGTKSSRKKKLYKNCGVKESHLFIQRTSESKEMRCEKVKERRKSKMEIILKGLFWGKNTRRKMKSIFFSFSQYKVSKRALVFLCLMKSTGITFIFYFLEAVYISTYNYPVTCRDCSSLRLLGIMHPLRL